jgi:hypothetical protein
MTFSRYNIVGCQPTYIFLNGRDGSRVTGSGEMRLGEMNEGGFTAEGLRGDNGSEGSDS